MLKRWIILKHLQMLIIRVGDRNVHGQARLINEFWLRNIVPWLFFTIYCCSHFLCSCCWLSYRWLLLLSLTVQHVVEVCVYIVFKINFISHVK